MSAIISNCGLYRYRLERDVAMEGITFAYFGINPSTAGPVVNDQTVGKWIGFTKINGGRRFIVGNVSCFRAASVKALATALVPPHIYRENLKHIQAIMDEADVLVPCWGDRKKVPRVMHNDIDQLMAMLLTSGKPVKHFGLTAGGDPKHPLMLGYATPLTPWINP